MTDNQINEAGPLATVDTSGSWVGIRFGKTENQLTSDEWRKVTEWYNNAALGDKFVMTTTSGDKQTITKAENASPVTPGFDDGQFMIAHEDLEKVHGGMREGTDEGLDPYYADPRNPDTKAAGMINAAAGHTGAIVTQIERTSTPWRVTVVGTDENRQDIALWKHALNQLGFMFSEAQVKVGVGGGSLVYAITPPKTTAR